MSDFTVGFLANLGSSNPWVVKHYASFVIYATDQTKPKSCSILAQLKQPKI